MRKLREGRRNREKNKQEERGTRKRNQGKNEQEIREKK